MLTSKQSTISRFLGHNNSIFMIYKDSFIKKIEEQYEELDEQHDRKLANLLLAKVSILNEYKATFNNIQVALRKDIHKLEEHKKKARKGELISLSEDDVSTISLHIKALLELAGKTIGILSVIKKDISDTK